MASTTIRVSEATRARLAALADASHRPMNAVVDEALDALERRQFFASFNDGYRRLRADDEDWASVTAEREEESSALRDIPE